jgi:two-component sensor histidine kinase
MDVADGRVKMQLSDTGPGLPEGIDWQTSPSFGLQLIRLLASHLNAELSVKNSHEGLTYHIVFNT